MEPKWRKGSKSNGSGGNNCVEICDQDDAVLVRDSKDTDGPALRFTIPEWRAFIASAKGGEFDR